jgi:hypothetical protein
MASRKSSIRVGRARPRIIRDSPCKHLRKAQDLPRGAGLWRDYEVPVSGFGIVGQYADFDRAAEVGKPRREAVERNTFHAAAENFRERRLIRAAISRGFFLRHLAQSDGLLDSADKIALRREFRHFCARESHIREDVAAAFVESHFAQDSVLRIQFPSTL